MSAVAIEAIPTHVTAVAGTEQISDRFVRVTFRGGLDGYRPLGPDQFVYLLLPPPGREELTIGTDFRWSLYDAMPEADRPVGAYYTVRQHRPEAGEIDCDVFLHDPAGPASSWAAAVQPGAPAALWGPRTAWSPPADTARWLLVADETGWPAQQAALEVLPDGADVITLLDRPDRLLDAVRGLELDPVGTYAWGGAERRAMGAIRRHLRRERGLAREQVSMTPYWTHPDHAGDKGDDGG